MAIRTIIIGTIFMLVASCRYDLDVTGVVYTPVAVNERFEMSAQWNSDNPERALTVTTDGYTLIVGSDSHVGGTVNLQRTFQIAEQEGAVALAIAGDVTTGREEDYEVMAMELVAAGDMPVCVVPGNHDLYFEGWPHFFEIFGASSYTFKVNTSDSSDLYIFLDTGGGTLGTSQLVWLQQLLEEERDSHRYTTVITHVNFFRNRFTTSTNILNEELLLLLDLFDRHNVNIVIQGHDHKRYEKKFRTTTYITLDAIRDDNDDASILQLEAGSEGIVYRFIEL
ncbi:MAG: metallophosphoesterase [Bacteroidales bacterium]